MTLSINDKLHDGAGHYAVVMLDVEFSFLMLNVIMLSVIILSVMAPSKLLAP